MNARWLSWLRAGGDAVVAVAAALLIVAVRWPWFKATLTPVSQGVSGPVMAPQGTATGLYGHPLLWVAAGLAAAQLALLLARHCPGGRLRVPGDGALLALGSGLCCLVVAAGVLLIPSPWADILSVGGPFSVPLAWEGTPFPFDGYTLTMTWSYGAAVALAAALASLAAVLASAAAGAAAVGGWQG